jgi:hypothetical protein
MPHPFLPELRIRLLGEIARGGSQTAVNNLGRLICGKLIEKGAPLSTPANKACLRWSYAFQSSASQASIFFANRDCNVLWKRSPEIEFYYCQRQAVLFSPTHATFIEVVRFAERFLFINPFAMTGNQGVESWGRPRTLSYKYNRHLPNSTVRGKARFLPGVDVAAIELRIFESGLGILKQADRAFLYALFSRDIGRLTSGATTQCVKMQCDRVHRSTGTGTQVNLHSYPVGVQELGIDFGAIGGNAVQHIINNPLPG